MTTAKKPTRKVEEMSSVEAVAAPLQVVKPRGKPGEKDFDWQTEYPGEEVYVFTASDGLTVGMTKLGPDRKPKPGRLRREHRAGGMSVMWYFLELVSSPNSLALQEELDEDDYTKMLRGWADFAGIDLGE
jgi:hypothetical protein